jgi:hypothetical protein
MSGLAVAILPRPVRPWGQAMRCEVEAIADAKSALSFAIGCLGFALREAVIFHILSPLHLPLAAAAGALSSQGGLAMTIRDDLLLRPRRMIALCAVAATGLGLAYMSMADAPPRYLAINAAALVLGLIVVGITASMARSVRVSADVACVALGVMMLLVSLSGERVDGAARWVSLGGLSVQPSLLFLPILATGFAGFRSRTATLGIVIAALALALQPDRAMSGALAAGLAVLALIRGERNVLIALAASILGFVVALSRPDTLPAVPYVDEILYSSFDVHPAAGLAVLAGAALMLLPAIIGCIYDAGRRETYAVCGAVWLAIIIAAALGNYPTPVVGYGGSAIIGYVLTLLGLPKRVGIEAVERVEAGARTPEGRGQILRAGLRRSVAG